MLNYRLPSGLPSGSRAAWSRLLLQPLAGDLLTPLSYSVLAEVAGRAWFVYYDRLDFDPIPRARVVRQTNGRAYMNLTLSAQREAEFAAAEPIAFKLDGALQALVKVEKPGLLASMKSGRAAGRQKKLGPTLAAEQQGLAANAATWEEKVRGFRWTQAEILLVMEEIEPEMTPAFVPFLAARQGIVYAVNRLMRLANQPPSETLRQLDRGLGSDGTLEAEMVRALAPMGARLPAALRAWIEAGAAGDWEGRLRDAGLLPELEQFLARFGHRLGGPAAATASPAAPAAPGELAAPRWAEDPAPLLRLLAQPPASPTIADGHAISVLLAAIDARERKGAEELIDSLRLLAPLQSRAIDALAHYLAGARRFGWGAAREAMGDQRILEADDIFFFELEEIKRMMTNEWNVSDRAEIQATAAKHRAQHEAWRALPAQAAPELFIGDSPAEPLDRLEPSPLLDPAVLLTPAARSRGLADLPAAASSN